MRNHSPRIFVMDDEQSFLDEMSEMLTLSGYHVETSSQNENVLEKIKSFNPTLLLLDLKMTPRSGFQIADEIKHSDGWQELPIIGMSGYFLEKEHLTLMNQCSITTFLAKPFNPLNLIDTIEAVINEQSVRSFVQERRDAGMFLEMRPSMDALRAVTT